MAASAVKFYSLFLLESWRLWFTVYFTDASPGVSHMWNLIFVELMDVETEAALAGVRTCQIAGREASLFTLASGLCDHHRS